MSQESKIELYEFENVATNIFGKVYPMIVEQAIERTGISNGTCIDLGTGCGHLGLSVAEKTDMKVYLYDILQDSMDICSSKIKEKNLEDRVKTLEGNVEDIPLEDEVIDLAISRGSLWFWEDKIKSLSEIYRILKPGGKAYLGGGFGNKELREEIDEKMIERSKNGSQDWQKDEIKRKSKETRENIFNTLESAKIDKFKIIDDETGYWVVFEK